MQSRDQEFDETAYTNGFQGFEKGMSLKSLVKPLIEGPPEGTESIDGWMNSRMCCLIGFLDAGLNRLRQIK